MPELLDSTQRQDALENLTGWSEADNGKAITKNFEFKKNDKKRWIFTNFAQKVSGGI